MIVFKFKAGSEKKDNAEMFKRLLVRATQDSSIYAGLSRAKVGDDVILEVRVEKPTRSLPQNAEFHRLVGLLAKESGYTFEEAKLYLKSNAVAFGYPQEVSKGQPVFFMGQPKGKPTHLATVQEMSILIDSTKDVLIQNFGFSMEELA